MDAADSHRSDDCYTRTGFKKHHKGCERPLKRLCSPVTKFEERSCASGNGVTDMNGVKRQEPPESERACALGHLVKEQS